MLLTATLLCFGCDSTDGGTGSPGAAGQSAGHGGQGGADAAQSGGADDSAGDGGDAAGSAGDGSEPGMSSGGTGPVSAGGTGGTGGTIDSGGSGGQPTAGATAAGGGGSNECVWDPSSTDHCPACDANDGCARPGYKYVGSGAITASCCALVWQEETAPGKYDWSGAADYCASLPLLGGGWRLPKIAELYSLVALGDGSPAIDADAFADTLGEAYWSSSLAGTSAQTAWSVNFSDGASLSAATDQLHRVRCVR